MIDFTKYTKIKTVVLKLKEPSGYNKQEDFVAEFNIKEYPDYDHVLEMKTLENTISECRSLVITMGKLIEGI